jgi:hypothetical protein
MFIIINVLVKISLLNRIFIKSVEISTIRVYPATKCIRPCPVAKRTVVTCAELIEVSVFKFNCFADVYV